MLTFYFYMSPSSTLVFPFLILLFILVMAENIVSQWATFIVFLNISPETIFAIITTNPSARLSFRSFWESVRDGIDGGNEKISLNKLLMLYDKPQFKEALKEVLSEIKKNLKLLKAEVLRVTLLPFKYIVSILIALALLVMALQVNWNGKAFKGLIFQNAESRNILSFTADMIECLYFSSVSVATIGYGTIAPKVSDEAEETNNCDLRFPSTFPVRGLMFGTALILLFTIFAAFSMAFRGVDELMKRLNDPKDLEFVIKELLERGIEDPTSFFIK
jgi:hypothetical protein